MTPTLTRADTLRFFNNINVLGLRECWLWKTASQRYGSFKVHRDGRAIGCSAHRVAWQLAHGEIPAGQQVLHRCDTPRCVNPAHLFLGTQAENIQDCVAKGRHKSLRDSGRKVTDEQIAIMLARANAGDKYIDIARDLGLSRTSVSYYARGVMHRTRHVTPVPKRLGHKWTPEEGRVLAARTLALHRAVSR